MAYISPREQFPFSTTLNPKGPNITLDNAEKDEKQTSQPTPEMSVPQEVSHVGEGNFTGGGHQTSDGAGGATVGNNPTLESFLDSLAGYGLIGVATVINPVVGIAAGQAVKGQQGGRPATAVGQLEAALGDYSGGYQQGTDKYSDSRSYSGAGYDEGRAGIGDPNAPVGETNFTPGDLGGGMYAHGGSVNENDGAVEPAPQSFDNYFSVKDLIAELKTLQADLQMSSLNVPRAVRDNGNEFNDTQEQPSGKPLVEPLPDEQSDQIEVPIKQVPPEYQPQEQVQQQGIQKTTVMKEGGKVTKVMHEFKEGNLKSSSGDKVTNPKQAVAIALSEQRRGKGMAEGGRVQETYKELFERHLEEIRITPSEKYEELKRKHELELKLLKDRRDQDTRPPQTKKWFSYEDGGQVPQEGAIEMPQMIAQPGAAPPEMKADDVPMQANEGDFILNSDAVEVSGLMDIKTMLRSAVEEALKDGKQVVLPGQGTDEDPVNIYVHNGEVHVPKELVKYIGEDKLTKINNRGLERRKEKEAKSSQQQATSNLDANIAKMQGYKDGGTVEPTKANEEAFFDRMLNMMKGLMQPPQVIVNVDGKGGKKKQVVSRDKDGHMVVETKEED